MLSFLCFRFALPSKILKGEGTLTCTVDDDGTIESTGQTIPILLQSLDMKIYAEGGYIVAGLPNKIYVEGNYLNKQTGS